MTSTSVVAGGLIVVDDVTVRLATTAARAGRTPKSRNSSRLSTRLVRLCW